MLEIAPYKLGLTVNYFLTRPEKLTLGLLLGDDLNSGEYGTLRVKMQIIGWQGRKPLRWVFEDFFPMRGISLQAS